jgi:hypothetical protein
MSSFGRFVLPVLALLFAFAVALTVTLTPNGGVTEPAKKSAPRAPAASAKSGQAEKQQQPQVVMPSAEQTVLLVRTTLLTLNDALQTGNFTVLRDIAAPSFREANSAGRLAQIFSTFVQQKIELSAVAILVPQVTESPVLDQKNGMLRIKGFFPGQPVGLDFEVIYQAVGGRWRVFALSVQPKAVPPLATASQGPATKQNTESPSGKTESPEQKSEPTKRKAEPAWLKSVPTMLESAKK